MTLPSVEIGDGFACTQILQAVGDITKEQIRRILQEPQLEPITRGFKL